MKLFSTFVLPFLLYTLQWNDKKFYPKKYSGADGGKADETEFPTLWKTDDNHPNKSLFFLAEAIDLLDAPGEWFVKDSKLLNNEGEKTFGEVWFFAAKY